MAHNIGSFARISCAFITTILLLTVSQAQAGELLKLRSGTLDLNELSFQTFGAPQPLNDSEYFVLQFEDRITEETKSQIAGLGLQTQGYLPDDALVVRSPSPREIQEATALLEGLRAVASFQANWKISPDLWEQVASGEKIDFLLISAFDKDQMRRLAAEIETLDLIRAELFTDRDLILTFRRPVQIRDIAALAQMPMVEWIEAMPMLVTFDLQMAREHVAQVAGAGTDFTGYESGTKVMKFDAAWERGFTGQGQVVAMADTGLDTGDLSTLHADLETVVKGYAMGFGATSWEDPQGHGTHVAGSVVGTGNASSGEIRGGAHGAGFVAQSMWTPIFGNIMPGSDFNRLMGTPYADGARIHTNSWGAPANLGAYDTMASRVDEFMWQNPDMLVLFAAGNSGQDANRDGRIDEGSVSSPGTAKNVLTVGASENQIAEGGIQKTLKELRDGDKKWGAEPIASDTLSNNTAGIAAFSSRGPTLDGRLKPEVVAPGTNILSLGSQHPEASKLWGAYNEHYVWAGGTSMATPLTAGAAAVVREYLVKQRGILNPSAALVKATLVHTAEDLFPGQYGTGPQQELPVQRPNMHEGYGRVDMDHVTSLGEETQIFDDAVGVGLRQEKSFSVQVASGERLMVTLAYTDAAGSTSAAKTLVNDLDLVVVGPSGRQYTLEDRTNNLEMLEIKTDEAGSYEISIRGVNVPKGKQGKQPFSLLVSRI